jgi:hypothetical protein
MLSVGLIGISSPSTTGSNEYAAAVLLNCSRVRPRRQSRVSVAFEQPVPLAMASYEAW